MKMLTTAGALNATDIGRAVTFNWTFPDSGVQALVTGDLLQVHHDSHVSSLTLHGGGATTEEFTVRHDVDVDAVLVTPVVTK
jgi:hypothetical protein